MCNSRVVVAVTVAVVTVVVGRTTGAAWNKQTGISRARGDRGGPGCRGDVPELETELVVEAEWEWSMAGDVDVDELVLVPSSVVFLKKLCCSA